MTGQKMRLLLVILDAVPDDPNATLRMGVGTMAKASGLDERTVTTVRNRFVNDGLLVPCGVVNRTNAYRICIDGMDDALRNTTPARAQGKKTPANTPANTPALAQGIADESSQVNGQIRGAEHEHEHEHEQTRDLPWNNDWSLVLETVLERWNYKQPGKPLQEKMRRILAMTRIASVQSLRVEAGKACVVTDTDPCFEQMIGQVVAQLLGEPPAPHADTVLFTDQQITAHNPNGHSIDHLKRHLFPKASTLETQ